MAFSEDIKKAFTESMKRGGNKITSEQDTAVTKMAEDLAAAIARWIMAQDFQIMKMKAILEVEELKTATQLQADISKAVQVQPGIVVQTDVPGTTTSTGNAPYFFAAAIVTSSVTVLSFPPEKDTTQRCPSA